MNDKNDHFKLGSTIWEEREGAPDLPTDGRASVGPIIVHQAPLKDDTASEQAMDISDSFTPTFKMVQPASSGSPQRLPSYQMRTSPGMNSVPPPLSSSPLPASPIKITLLVNPSGFTPTSPLSITPGSSAVNCTARKRLKLTDGSDKASAVNEDVSGLRKRILEHKMTCLRHIRERHVENAAELFYLQSEGNMVDYQAWRKRPPTAQLLGFLRSHRLEAGDDAEDISRSVGQPAAAPVDSSNAAPRGAEIKIPGVGITPVAVSTTLPAAVAQLTQQGSIPGRPAGGRHGMVFAPHRQHSAAAPRLPGGTPLVVENQSGPARSNLSHPSPLANNTALSSSQEQIVEKAKQEAYVMQRICELQKEGLWTERRLPKVVEPPRPKAHWDYLLEEMVWLAADFAQERKWKKAAAKKCARMVQKHFQEKALAAQKAEKAQEYQLKRIAAFVAKEIRIFWSNVEKLVEFKQQTRMEEQRKQALDHHLSFIVDQTEKYSQQLAEGMRSTPHSNSKHNSRRNSATLGRTDVDFCPSGAASTDDEETISEVEREEPGMNTHPEVEALQRESQMEFDEFLNELPKDYLENRDKIKLSDDESEVQEDDADFEADEDSRDICDTISEEEKMDESDDHKKEIDTLNAENEMSIEELRKKYSGTPKDVEIDSPSESEREEDSDDESTDDDHSADGHTSDSTEEDEPCEGLNALVDKDLENPTEDDHRMEDAAAIAESLQPKGNTLSSTRVVTEVPHLLRHSLREYQHIGLDWLVTMEQRRLNGILADEMGLGKTIQTIALLAHLACEKQDWGPHLIVVPTSVMLNWEMECKKWCPGFKILTYYGTQKERKLKRTGWTKPDAFHICVTSYKLVIQDHQSFRRKKWKYLILDEAQNIKNFKSQRWQLLLNFQTQQRLLLTGTPLQNNLMELWSLMHFLMPDIFASHREFKEWFSNPVTGMIEGNSEYNENIIRRLHKVLRPFLLRRLKSEVEKQMPKKYEHIIMCRLSKRQRFLYDDFMSRAKTRETLSSGNLLSVINVLMQLRKVCNHPNLFEVRPTISPFQMEGIDYRIPSVVYNLNTYDPLKSLNFSAMNLNLLHTERTVSAFESHRVRSLQTPRRLIEEIDSSPPPPPPCPKAAVRIHVSLRPIPVSNRLPVPGSSASIGTSPRMTSTGDGLGNMATRTAPPKNERLAEGGQPVNNSLSQPLTPLILKQLANARTSSASVSQLKDKSFNDTDAEARSEFYQPAIEELLKARRKALLVMLHDVNDRRCNACPLYGEDLREACAVPVLKFCDTIQKDVATIEGYTNMFSDIFKRFVVYICGAMGPAIRGNISHGTPWRLEEEKRIECEVRHAAKPVLNLLHPIKTHLTTHFPDPRLIQYDCGKLQTLDNLLRKLRTEQHRVLIFTQMTKMLDVLEAFLNFHGHIYLRLDGTTRVEQRQILMERFNSDPRIFAFILSTRSGGVGVNLTGADTVVFYDSDWNPTMDAQAQDRCHRIGQTRDVHIYRLVSEKTIEENILKKANQKRMLGDVAIEGGNFTTAYFKSTTIQDLFDVGKEEDAGRRMEVSKEISTESEEPSTGGVSALESALAQCEDEADVMAARTARAEVAAELAEFDESIPIEEQPQPEQQEQPLSKAEQELQTLMQQLSPVERFAMRTVEASEAAAFAEQQAAAEMEKQKKEWEAARRLLQRPDTPPPPDPALDRCLTFSRRDAANQVWLSQDATERMPMWCPPTPPQGDDDVYVDVSLGYLYDWRIMLESQLPPVYVKRENKRPRPEAGHSPDGRRPLKTHRKEEAAYAPRTLFERPSPALAKMRRDLKLQKYRGVARPPAPLPGSKPPPRLHPEPDALPDWSVTEDMALLRAVRSQGLPLDLAAASAAHTPNWDLVADLVNNFSGAYRSPKQCRNRYEAAVLPREEGKPSADSTQKKQKKTKGVCKTTPRGGRPAGTSRLYEQDNNVSFTRAVLARHDAMKGVLSKKTAAPKRRYDDPNMKNPKHAAVLSDYGVDYETPPTPMEIAARRAERIAKEKQKSAPAAATPAVDSPATVRLQTAAKVAASPPTVGASPTITTLPNAAPLRTPQRASQPDPAQRQQRIVVAPQQGASVVAKAAAAGTVTAGGKPLNSGQLQYLRQQALARQKKLFHQPGTVGQQGTLVQQMSVGQQVVSTTKTVPVSVAAIQVSSPQQRPQIAQAVGTVSKQTIARVTDVDINTLYKRQQALTQQKQLQAVQGASGERVGVTVGSGISVGGSGVKSAAGSIGVLSGVATAVSGKAPMKMATPQQLRQLQMQQFTMAQRQGHKLTQVGGSTQVIVQAQGGHKTLPAGVTVQHLQQVMRQIPQAGARVMPRQTIQVVGGNVSQVRAAHGVSSGTAGHTQVILSQVSAALQRQPSACQTGARPQQPTTLSMPAQQTQAQQLLQQQTSTTAHVQQMPPADSQPK